MPLNKEQLGSVLLEIKNQVEPVMEKILVSQVAPKFHPIVKYQVSTGGKRLRPALAAISCKMLGGKMKDVLHAAASLEILHNYTLIVDDIIDCGLLRRNQPTLWVKYGKSMAECVGIDYSVSIFQAAMLSPEPIHISKLLAETLKKVIDGEIADILFERTGREHEPFVVKNRPESIGQKEYIKMIEEKTACLFQASCQAGGLCAKANQKEINLLKNYGFNLGVAFQIQDDILDIFGKEKEFGKKIGKDIEERKGGNIVLLFALKELVKKDKEIIRAVMTKKNIKEKDIKKVISLIKKTTTLQKSIKFGQGFITKAKASLRQLPQNKWNKILKNLADFVIKRSV